MSTTKKIYEDPTNRVVCIFDESQKAKDARAALTEIGFAASEVRVLQGEDDASAMDTSAKWFADTDEEMKKIQRELLAGNTVIAVPVHDRERREVIHKLLKSHDARHVTHFGEWITEVMH